jgi:hypothetical protein
LTSNVDLASQFQERILPSHKRKGASRHEEKETQSEGTSMLWTIFVILVVLWLLGFTIHIGGGLIHILLVIALIVLIVQLIQGRRPL